MGADSQDGRAAIAAAATEAIWRCVLGCYSAAGFADDLRSAKDSGLALITLGDIYGGR